MKELGQQFKLRSGELESALFSRFLRNLNAFSGDQLPELRYMCVCECVCVWGGSL